MALRTTPALPLALVLSGAVAMATARPAGAGQKLGALWVSGRVESGWHEISGNPASAEFEEYRDEQQWVGRGRFLLEDEQRRWFLRGSFSDVAQDDEHYRLELGRWGRWNLWGDYREIPHHFSTNAETPNRSITDDTLTLPFARPAADLGAAVNGTLQSQDLEFRSVYGRGGLSWHILENLELSSEYRLIDKKGTLFRGGLGQPFAFVGAPLFTFIAADFTSFASPVDEKIHELTTRLDWVHQSLSVSLDYVGSVYDNDVGDSLTVDSPFVGMDVAAASSRWRQSLAPDNQAHTANLAAAWVLPTPFPARLTSTVSYGMRIQEDAFIPMTVNSVHLGDPRIRPSQGDLDGRVEMILADFRFTSRPLPRLHVDGHYRYYDYDNDSDAVRLDAIVTNDGPLSDDVPGEADRVSVANGYERQEASLEATYRLFAMAKLGLGWEWERWKRSGDRPVRETDEHGPDVSLDLRPVSWAQIRSRYSFRARNRSDYGPFNHFEDSFNAALLEEVEELAVFPEVRNAPLAALHSHEATFQTLVQPWETVSLALNAGLQFDDYHRSDYGLRDDERWWAGADATWTPLSWLEVSVYYTFDRWLLVQQSRQRDQVVGDVLVRDVAADDWTTNTTEIAHNVGADVGVTILPDRLWADVRYDFQRATVRTRSGGNLVPAAEDFPTVRSSLHVVHTTLTYRVNEMFQVKGYYRWERFVQQDFHLDDIRPFTPSISTLSLFLGNEVDDHRAHVYGATFVFEF